MKVDGLKEGNGDPYGAFSIDLGNNRGFIGAIFNYCEFV